MLTQKKINTIFATVFFITISRFNTSAPVLRFFFSQFHVNILAFRAIGYTVDMKSGFNSNQIWIQVKIPRREFIITRYLTL